MKRFWRTWLILAATASMTGSAQAQQGWNQPAEIGSYQSILARAGYTSGQNPSQQATPTNVNSYQNAPAMQPSYGVAPQNGPSGSNGWAQPASGCGDGSCGNGYASGSGCGGGYAGSSYVDNGYADGCSGDSGVYEQTSGIGNRFRGMGLGGRSSNAANYVFGARALFFRRNHEDDVQFSRNGAGDVLTSNDNRMGTMGGVDLGLTKRKCNGNGMELRYWGLYPGAQTASIYGPGLSTYQNGLNALLINGGTTNLEDYYNNSDYNQITRRNIFHNAEANLLRNGSTYQTRHCRTGNYELLGGFRWFQFNEDYQYSAFYPSNASTQVDYNLDVNNTLLGFQLGARNQVCLTNRLSLASAVKFGLFNNYITHSQNVRTNAGVYAYETATGVDDYNYSSSQNSLSTLGELDMGLNYRVSNSARVNVGYRVIGITGIALAPAQIPSNYTYQPEIEDINSNGDLILGGGYAGMEFCY